MGSPVLASFDTYVRRRLDAWGTEFRLDRDADFLGFPSKNVLQVLHEHRGEIPERTSGYRPMLIPPLEWQMEMIVHDMNHAAGYMASTLRAYYCGSGRVGVERLELLESMLGRKVGRRAFFQYHDLAFQWVSGALLTMARNDAG
jgi:hypothetical protein